MSSGLLKQTSLWSSETTWIKGLKTQQISKSKTSRRNTFLEFKKSWKTIEFLEKEYAKKWSNVFFSALFLQAYFFKKNNSERSAHTSSYWVFQWLKQNFVQIIYRQVVSYWTFCVIYSSQTQDKALWDEKATDKEVRHGNWRVKVCIPTSTSKYSGTWTQYVKQVSLKISLSKQQLQIKQLVQYCSGRHQAILPFYKSKKS